MQLEEKAVYNPGNMVLVTLSDAMIFPDDVTLTSIKQIPLPGLTTSDWKTTVSPSLAERITETCMSWVTASVFSSMILSSFP